MSGIRDEQLAQILRTLRKEFSRALGDQLDSMYLFGSQARGEALQYSDIDVLVVVRGGFDYMDLIRRTSGIVWDLSLQHDAVISRVFVSREQFLHEESPFLLNVRREAVAVA
jgi:predicted nucleotidyltransferase